MATYLSFDLDLIINMSARSKSVLEREMDRMSLSMCASVWGLQLRWERGGGGGGGGGLTPHMRITALCGYI